MQIYLRQFNLYFAPVLALALFCGCQTDKKEKQTAALRVHIEVNADDAGDLSTAQTIRVLRSNPVQVTIAKEPILTEADILGARIISDPGGSAIQIQFDGDATLILEQYSAANPRKHFVIYGQWGDKLANGRWLAAPLITKRISNGVLTFTADMSADEANQLVLGLRNVAEQTLKSIPKALQ